MRFYDTLDDLRDCNNITQIEVINDILNQTQKDPERIQMFIDEIDFYLYAEKEELESEINSILQRIFNEGLTTENTKDLDLDERGKYILHICERDGIKSFFDIPEKKRDLIDSNHPLAKQMNEVTIRDYSHFYFVGEFWSIYSLKNKLKKYITPPQPEQQPEPKKKQSKYVWGLVARYNFLKDLGVLDKLYKLTETDKAKAISQILNCNIDNAKKLKNGKYPTNETKDEQLERKQLIDLIKRTQTD